MKNFTNLLLITVLLAGFGSIGCEDDNPSGPSRSDLVGTWSLDKLFINGEEEETWNLTYTFLADGTGNTNDDGNINNFTWSVSGNTISINEDGATVEMTVSVSDSILTLEGSAEVNDEPYTWKYVLKKVDNPPPETQILGTWILNKLFVDGVEEDLSMNLVMTFSDDGTGSYNQSGEIGSFTWSLNENILTYVEEGETTLFTIEVSESTLTLEHEQDINGVMKTFKYFYTKV